MKKKKPMSTRILIAMALGILFGIVISLLPEIYGKTLVTWGLGPIGSIFIRAIRMTVVPLVFVSLVVGTASMGDIKKLGRVGIKTVVYYTLTTALAISLALVLANLLSPGAGVNKMASSAPIETAKPPFIMDMFVNMVPVNPVEAMVKGDMLQIIVFAIVVGIALTAVGKKAEGLVKTFEQLNDVMLKIIDMVMILAPVGVFALISQVIITQGTEVLLSLGKYVLVLALALAIHTFGFYSLSLKFLAKVSPSVFFKKFWKVMMMAFSTSSSNATLPLNMKTCEEDLGVPKSLSSFILPLGATINMDGTAIMQGVAAVFIAQVYGIDLSFQAQLMIILTATLASIGTAGVPSVGLVTLTMVLNQVGLPVEGIALVMSVDRILDMARTATNITGDAICAVFVARTEKELDEEAYYSEKGSLAKVVNL